MGKVRSIRVVVGTALEKKIGVKAREEYEQVLTDAQCVNEEDDRIMTATFLTNGLFIARTRRDKSVYDLLPLLNHAEPKNKWLDNIKTKIIPRLK